MLRYCSFFFHIKGSMRLQKRDIIKILSSCAQAYQRELVGKEFLVLYQREKTESCSFRFAKSNFLHLTGVQIASTISAQDFFDKCLEHKLSEQDFSAATDGTTDLKLSVLPRMICKNFNARMIGNYRTTGIALYTEKLLGGTMGCIGFVMDAKGGYVPNTLLNEDVRDVVDKPCRVLAIFRKNQGEPKYTEMTYLAKGIKDELTYPQGLGYLQGIVQAQAKK